MLEQIFNSPEVANAGIYISGLATAFSVAALIKGVSDFRKDHKIWPRIGSGLQVAVSAGAAAVSAWVGAEAHQADMNLARNAPIERGVNDYPLAPEPESAPSVTP